jgi:hypothetical protein
MRRRNLAGSLVLASLVVACGPGFDPPSVVESLRVLAVRPEPGSGAPGQTVRLEMLYADGTLREPGDPLRPIQIAWLGGCHNPESRLYFGCFPTISALARGLSARVVDTPPDALPPGSFGVGTTFDVPIPSDILSSAPRYTGDPVHFGVSYAFFAACAGELRPRPERTDRVPLACVDPTTGFELDSDDFVEGFATVPTYEGIQNENPLLTALSFGSFDLVDQECDTDEDCDGLSGATAGKFGCLDSQRCAPVVRPCSPDDGDCPRTLVFPEIDTASAEELPGEDGREILWANFYATDGDFQSDAQLVNDRATGWVEDHGAYFVAPDEAGTVDLYVTVHDERGGAAWSSFRVIVRD